MPEPTRSRESRDSPKLRWRESSRRRAPCPSSCSLADSCPDLGCTRADHPAHQGTTDVDLQVDLEIANGSLNASRLERALLSAGFRTDDQRAWRWQDSTTAGTVVKVEFLADLDDVPNHTTVLFDACEQLGAVNLRGTGFAARDSHVHRLRAVRHDERATFEIRIAGIAGYLLAKIHAAYGRQARKDWYDIAYVVLHNDLGGPLDAADRVLQAFESDLIGQTRTALDELASNFADPSAQGSDAYAAASLAINPELDRSLLANDAVAANDAFTNRLREKS